MTYRCCGDLRKNPVNTGESTMTRQNAAPLPNHMPEDRANPYGLTPREQEMAILIAEGLTSRAAGIKLGISHRTVEIHRAHVMRKVGARNSAHLVHIISTLTRLLVPRSEIVYTDDFVAAFDEVTNQPANDTAQLGLSFK